MIRTIDGFAFTDQPFFDTAFIHQNHIQSIGGNYSIKKEADMIRPTNDFFRYEFDTLGRLTETFEVRFKNDRKDTLFNHYEYNSNGKIVLHRKTENGGITAYHYVYDSLGRVIKTEHRREILDSLGRLSQSLLINSETMKYQAIEHGYRKTVFNNYNLPYLEQTEKWTPEGYLIEETQRMKMASSEYKKKYTYGEGGLPGSIAFVYNDSEIPYEEWRFRYDKFGNVIEKLVFKNGKEVNNLQIIYDTKTALLSATIQQETNANYMLILRFQEYCFYPHE